MLGASTKKFLLPDLWAAGGSGFLANPLITYQDTGTTTPATLPGEAVGHILSQPGPVTPLDPTQGTSSAKPVWAVAPFGGIENRLAAGGVPSEAFSGSAWTASNSTVADGASGILASAAPSTSNSSHTLFCTSLPVTSGVSYTFFYIFKAGVASWIQMSPTAAGFDEANAYGNFDLGTGVVGNKGSGATTEIMATPASLIASFPELAGSYICRLTATADATSAASGPVLAHTNPASPNPASRAPIYVGVATNTVLLSRAMVAEGTRDIAWYIANYQTVTTASNVTQSGVTSVPWIYGTTDDWMDFGAVGFGTATQGFYAAAGQNWTLIERYCGFTGGGFTVAQCGGGATTTRMFTSAIDAAGTWGTRLRGTLNTTVATYLDGVPHIISTVCTNGVVTRKIDNGARETLTNGSAAAESLNITFMCRTASAPSTFLTGRAVPEVIEDRALSEAEELQAMRLISSQIGGLVS